MQRSANYENGEFPHRSSVWDKWNVAGMTRIERDLSRADITVTHKPTTPMMIKEWAMRHEHGHADVAEDLLDAVGNDEAPELLRSYDKWQNEVESWTRTEKAIGERAVGELILDCLNSYRRGLKIDDEEWDDAQDLIADMGTTVEIRQHLRNYVPLEPYDDEPPPSCGSGPSLDPEDGRREEPEDEDGTDPEDDEENESEEDDDSGSDDGEDDGQSEDDGDDESEDDSEDDGDDEQDGQDWGDPVPEALPDDGEYDPDDQSEDKGGHDWDHETQQTLENIWNDPDVIKQLKSGRTLADVAAELGVPVSTASPLAIVMANR